MSGGGEFWHLPNLTAPGDNLASGMNTPERQAAFGKWHGLLASFGLAWIFAQPAAFTWMAAFYFALAVVVLKPFATLAAIRKGGYVVSDMAGAQAAIVSTGSELELAMQAQAAEPGAQRLLPEARVAPMRRVRYRPESAPP